ncbi:hypothetical protein MLD38_010168 [Melastoma candidum]|uniref:Uncharacterized protein n=1 Tax=Melastoma candidum TaxID=119954 RepID=A0ACB9R319_9MYRT|nr:hypothetical protein MLD38_010168 [Melastoma candidum]
MKVKGGAKRRTLFSPTDDLPPTPHSFPNAPDPQVQPDAPFVIGGEEKGQCADEVVVPAAEGGEEEGEENDGDAGEDDGDGEEGEGEEEGEEEEEEEDAGEEEQRPKLAEGFYEIEAVRRKRVRKGEVQYLIKWRGWPEAANTWEPFENLSYCVDVVEAFEERLMSGKSRSSRKRKRKNATPHIQPKKKQHIQHSRSALVVHDTSSADDIPTQKNSTVLEDVVPLQSVRFGLSAVVKSNVSKDLVSGQSTEKGSRRSFQTFNVRQEEPDYDPKLSELRGTASSNGFPRNSSTTSVQEAKNSGGSASAGTPPPDSVEPVQSARRVGARRRKPNSVKRFKQEMVSESSFDQNGFRSTAYNMNPEMSNSKGSPVITKIIKPIGFSASVANNIQDVSVTFMVMRSDGKEVMVDNNFLKANYPLLLIDFYEQHLRYSPTS